MRKFPGGRRGVNTCSPDNTQRDYERYRRRFGSLAAYARHLNHVELRHVNLLPFYDNAESIVEFLETIRG